ncbi:MAG: hypothetical protein AAFR38_00565 [Planctomycetota bacterium]
MPPFQYLDGELMAERVRVADVADRFGTPLIVHSARSLARHHERIQSALTPIGASVHFAVDACPDLGVLRALAERGAGFYAGGGLHLERAWLAGASMQRVVLAGVGKSDEVLRAAVDGVYSPMFGLGTLVGDKPASYRGPVGLLSLDNPLELERLRRAASGLRVNCRAMIRVAIDPDGEGETKFGVSPDDVELFLSRHDPAGPVKIVGLHAHTPPGGRDAARIGRTASLLCELGLGLRARHEHIDTIDVGGGWAAVGLSRRVELPETYADAVSGATHRWVAEGGSVIVEPGRAISASAGILVTRVLDVKRLHGRDIAYCDAGLEERLRPSDAGGFRLAWPVSVDSGQEPPSDEDSRIDSRNMHWADLAGPTGRERDALARGRLLPKIESGDLIAVFGAGAYASRCVLTQSGRDGCARIIVDEYSARLTRAKGDGPASLRPELDTGSPA